MAEVIFYYDSTSVTVQVILIGAFVSEELLIILRVRVPISIDKIDGSYQFVPISPDVLDMRCRQLKCQSPSCSAVGCKVKAVGSQERCFKNTVTKCRSGARSMLPTFGCHFSSSTSLDGASAYSTITESCLTTECVLCLVLVEKLGDKYYLDQR